MERCLFTAEIAEFAEKEPFLFSSAFSAFSAVKQFYFQGKSMLVVVLRPSESVTRRCKRKKSVPVS